MNGNLVLRLVKRGSNADPRIALLNEELQELASRYFEPLKYKNVREMIDFLEQSRETFFPSFNVIIGEVISIIGDNLAEKALGEVEKAEKELSQFYPSETREPFIDAFKLQVENALTMLREIRRKDNLTVLMSILNENFIKITSYATQVISALVYFSANSPRGSFDKNEPLYETGRRLSELALDYAEELDTYIETFLVSINPKEKRAFIESLKTHEAALHTSEELEAWLQAH